MIINTTFGENQSLFFFYEGNICTSIDYVITIRYYSESDEKYESYIFNEFPHASYQVKEIFTTFEKAKNSII